MIRTRRNLARICILCICGFVMPFSQALSVEKSNKTDTLINSQLVSGLKFRNIGPAFTSGRIADFAVNPNNYSEFYVAAASGNIWKTTNNGTTFEPVFDSYGAYSIGCLAIDPSNTNVVWAGTGENNHQRELGYGDGVYLTLDGGKSWKNMGLKNSRQIGMICIHPEKTNVVYVAAEGSVWGPGGDRGLYKTTDRGLTWNKVLHISENTGINNVVCDPRNPEILYVTSEQRRRHVHTKVGGGPETGFHKSEDGGKNWKKLTSGLPTENMGGISIAISPQNPDVLYAIIEAANQAGGFFRSADRGESWIKMSDHTESGQYFNEIYCDPVQFDKVYSMETFSHVTTDGGKTWQRISTTDRHVDDHAIWVNSKDNRHLMIGGDGGVYITYDACQNWRQVSNLPVTQFYRVAVDNQKPFYHVYGGTQDNATLGGPSQNTSEAGVTSGEWIVTVFGDGFWPRIDPTNPDIVYSEWQYGNIVRYDKKSGERIYIKPQPKKGELTYRWNWNTPLILSHHNPQRIYIGANKLFRSNDRGSGWETISGDLTAQLDRNQWPVMDKYWSIDAVAKDVSTSQFGTIVSLDESRKNENLLVVGTDDGWVQITSDGGKTWGKYDNFPGVPKNTFVSDVYTSRFNENVIFVSFNNLKRDDFKPYLFKSSDKGKTWVNISTNLPVNGSIHSIEQDFINPDLLFVGIEFGIFFTVDGGNMWTQLKAGLPTIPVRDMAIQEEFNDLVLATFGRGFYILDDYSPLRYVTEEKVKLNAQLFPVRDAFLFIRTDKIYGQGATYYCAPNPPFGAVFQLYLKEVPKTKKQLRHEQEKKLFEQGKPIPQPSNQDLTEEKEEVLPYLMVTIRDAQGDIVRTCTEKPEQGIQRYYWDLKYEQPNALGRTETFDPFKKSEGGIFVLPGSFSVEFSLVHQGKVTLLGQPQKFEVKPLNTTTLPAENRPEMVAFQKEMSQMTKTFNGTIALCKDLKMEVKAMKQAAITLPNATGLLVQNLDTVFKVLTDIEFQLFGTAPKASWEEVPPAEFPLYLRLNSIIEAQITSTSAITETSKMSFEVLKQDFPPVLEQLTKLVQQTLPELRSTLDKMGAPYTPGRIPVWDLENRE